MKRVLIIPGYEGADIPHWESWIYDKLIMEGYSVYFPQLPNREKPILKDSIKIIKKIVKEYKPNIVIADSLGTTLWLHLCNNMKINFKYRLFLVSTIFANYNKKYNTVLKDFFPLKMPKSLHTNHIVMIQSTNDPFAGQDFDKIKEFALNHKAKWIELKNKGHINVKTGYGPFPLLLKLINTL